MWLARGQEGGLAPAVWITLTAESDNLCTNTRRSLKQFRQEVTAPALVVPFSRLRQAKPIS